MTTTALPLTHDPAGSPAGAGVRVTALSVIFVVSGFCGLIYESIWSHYLKLFVGHAAYAQTVVLVVFIGGMAIGAWLVGRVAQRIRSPLVVYAVVEAAIGVISLLFHPAFVATTNWGYATLLPATCGPESTCVSQWVLAALMILPQSVMLGTTFPLMTAGILRLAPRNPGSQIALFYFLNSIGAVAGVLAAAFILVPAFGLPGALLTAGLLNIAVAIGAYACAKGAPHAPVSDAERPLLAEDTTRLRRLLLVVAALTGLSSFIYEIAWIRMLSLVIGASTDAFELMLAAFILGLALGGLWVRKRIDRFRNLIWTLAVVQVLMGILAVGTLPVYHATFDVLAWFLRSLSRSDNGYVLYNLVSHAIALVVMLPATFLAGMTLPLITTALMRSRQGEKAIGFVYAANTFGAIAGIVIAVHFALPVLGLKGALILGAAIDVALAFALIGGDRLTAAQRSAWAWALAGAASLAGVALFVPVDVERMAAGVYRFGVTRLGDQSEIVYHAVGKTANIDFVRGPRQTSIRTNGKVDASIALDPTSPTDDEYTMTLTGVLPLVYRPDAQHAAVIGFGSGMTTATLLGSSVLKRVDTIEIEPKMIEGARHFGERVEAAFVDPRSRIIIDDAKSYFARSGHRYDIIVSEPSNPWVSGVASLFTVEFYQRVRRQLASNGLFVQWIQAYEFSDALLATILRALDSEFGDYAVYASNAGDMIIVASERRLPRPSDAFARFPGLRSELRRLSMDTLDEIEARRISGASSVRSLLAKVRPAPNSDYYPLVDLGAPRARFVGGKAKALLDLPAAPVPVIEMIEGRTDAFPWTVAAEAAPGDRRMAIVDARTTAAWLVHGTEPAERLGVPRSAGVVRSILWNCALVTPGSPLSVTMRELAALVNPHLSPAEAGQLWSAVRAAPCANRLTPDEAKWVDLFEAVGARDARRMASIGTALATTDEPLRPEMRGYAIIAAVTGMLTTGDVKLAGEFLDANLKRLPKQAANESLFVLLQGRAGMAEAQAVAMSENGR